MIVHLFVFIRLDSPPACFRDGTDSLPVSVEMFVNIYNSVQTVHQTHWPYVMETPASPPATNTNLGRRQPPASLSATAMTTTNGILVPRGITKQQQSPISIECSSNKATCHGIRAFPSWTSQFASMPGPENTSLAELQKLAVVLVILSGQSPSPPSLVPFVGVV